MSGNNSIRMVKSADISSGVGPGVGIGIDECTVGVGDGVGFTDIVKALGEVYTGNEVFTGN